MCGCSNIVLSVRNIKHIIFFLQLKPTIKTEGSIKGTTAHAHKEEISTPTAPTGSAACGKQKSRKSKHKRLMQQVLGSVDGKYN